MRNSHYFHIVNPSPWPILASFVLFNFIVSVVLYFNYEGTVFIINHFLWLIINFLCLVCCVFWWVEDIVSEGSLEGKHTMKVQQGLKVGMLLFILSEVMFFVSFFWAYFDVSLSAAVEIGGVWPPYGIQGFNFIHIPLYNTIILLLSGVCVTWAHNEILKNIKNKFKVYFSMVLTILLAITFTYWQAQEYIMSSFNITDSVYGSIFFVTTGFHGIHVIIGTVFLAISFRRLLEFHFTRTHHLGLEFAIWYWHFVDVVWLFLYIVIYWGSNI